jgi:hypothetical protein
MVDGDGQKERPAKEQHLSSYAGKHIESIILQAIRPRDLMKLRMPRFADVLGVQLLRSTASANITPAPAEVRRWTWPVE